MQIFSRSPPKKVIRETTIAQPGFGPGGEWVVNSNVMFFGKSSVDDDRGSWYSKKTVKTSCLEIRWLVEFSIQRFRLN